MQTVPSVRYVVQPLEVAHHVDNVGDTSMVYLGYNCDVDVASRKQVTTCMDVEPVQSSVVVHTDVSQQAVGSVTSECSIECHLHKKSNKVDK